ncbi:MAG: DUF4301 family protein [Bacteroidales bacterium]|nr:DUF4301 family protein [Bacteroidales bacterium]
MTTLNNRDLQQIKEKNISAETIEKQIQQFKEGFPFIKLKRPATINDGIFKFPDSEVEQLAAYYDQQSKNYDIIKFVPSSGAASRMFKDLYTFMQDYNGSQEQLKALNEQEEFRPVKYFFDHLAEFAFYQELRRVLRESGYNLEECLEKNYYKLILEYVLTTKGMNYANKPKALILFHSYDDNARLSLEEHLVEGAHYAMSNKGKVKIHFTVSPEHMEDFKHAIQQKKIKYENKFRVYYDISYSIQKPSTDTIAVTPDNEPFRNSEGTIVFRPGGHGALIENLNDLKEDVVFIKNIDNVVPDRLKEHTHLYKKVLGGYLLKVKNKIDNYLELLYEGSATEEELEEMRYFAQQELLIANDKKAFDNKDYIEKVDLLYNQLNRPVRVCGMVKNEGEPGGGPFWVQGSTGKVSLQIVEKAQIDFDNAQQKEIAGQATHFNPVDLVCAINDFNGEPFNLKSYVDPSTGFISEKSKEGKKLKALELPGLWNGAMAEWITVFVQVPIITFNPVKVINDLLRENHK